MNNVDLNLEQATQLLKLSKQFEELIDDDFSDSDNWLAIYVSSYLRILSLDLMSLLQQKDIECVGLIRKQCIKSLSKFLKRPAKASDVISLFEENVGRIDGVFIDAINKDFEQLEI